MFSETVIEIAPLTPRQTERRVDMGNTDEFRGVIGYNLHLGFTLILFKALTDMHLFCLPSHILPPFLTLTFLFCIKKVLKY